MATGRTVFSLIVDTEERDTISLILCYKMTLKMQEVGSVATLNWRSLHLSNTLPLYQIWRSKIVFTLKDLKE